MPETKTINVPGRVIDFYQGGEAWVDYTRNDPPVETRNLGADELALFQAVDTGRQVRPSKGGYYVRAELSPEAQEAALYWAETLYSASGDDARSGDQEARNDQRAAGRLLKTLRGW